MKRDIIVRLIGGGVAMTFVAVVGIFAVEGLVVAPVYFLPELLGWLAPRMDEVASPHWRQAIELMPAGLVFACWYGAGGVLLSSRKMMGRIERLLERKR
jgi:hypothetical protein